MNLERFPFHFLFRIVDDRVRVLVVRHHSRRPSLGDSTSLSSGPDIVDHFPSGESKSEGDLSVKLQRYLIKFR